MGNSFEVWVWKIADNDTEFRYHPFWSGEDFDQAIEAMKQAKREGAGCVKLEWRGEYEEK